MSDVKELIAWLDETIAVIDEEGLDRSDKTNAMFPALRARLIAAQEMSRVLEYISDNRRETLDNLSDVRKALETWETAQ